jgi:hypothetical protein
MDVVGRLDPDTGKVVEYPFPHAENSPRDFFMDDKGRIGCTARASLGCWVDLGFREFVLTLDSNITVGGLGAGAFSLFEDEAQSAPQGLARRVGQYLNHCVSIATEYAHSHPRAARGIGAGAMVAVAGVGTLHALSSLFAVAILLGTLKDAYSAVQIALMIAAVLRHVDATKQKLISASGQPQRNWRKWSKCAVSQFDGRPC